MGNYKEAQATAEKALEGAPELLDFNELGYAPVESYPEMEGLPAQDVYNCETHKWTTIKYLYWKEFLSHVLLMRVVNGLFHLMI